MVEELSEVIWWRDDNRQAILVGKVYDGGTYVGTRTLYNRTVHRKESRGCGDLFVWFGGPFYNSSWAQSSVDLSLHQTPAAIGSYNHQTSF